MSSITSFGALGVPTSLIKVLAERGIVSPTPIQAATLADAMSGLEIPTFAVVGHDRGARVAYRLALDHPKRIAAIAVLDVIAILDMAERMADIAGNLEDVKKLLAAIEADDE